MKIKLTGSNKLVIPKYFDNNDKLLVPQKLIKKMDYIDVSSIHECNQTAKEICLLFLTSLNSQIYKKFSGEDLNGTYLLSSVIKQNLNIGNNYCKVIQVLRDNEIITVNDSYMVDNYPKCYSLNKKYYTRLAKYTVVSKHVKNAIKIKNYNIYSKSVVNPIIKNLIQFYSYIELPTNEELLKIGNEKAKLKETNKKGKIFTKLGNNVGIYPDRYSYWKTPRCFFEDDIEYRYKLLTEPNLMIPTEGNSNCPRVYDSISLMPGWIRPYIKNDGENLVELDFRCLHPNLIINLYDYNNWCIQGYETKYLTHDFVAESTGMNVKDVKTLHLSFFNCEIWQMNSDEFKKLHEFYDNYTPGLLEVVKQAKYENYKITSQQLFTLEVNLMTEIIRELNLIDIYVGYIYDALLVKESDVQKVKEIMKIVSERMNIFVLIK